jgi:hypothetical protein
MEGVAYPYWEHRFGWRTAGARRDTLAGRRVMTVFYVAGAGRSGGAGERIGYSILAGPALQTPSAGRTVDWSGVRFQILRIGGLSVVTWRRAGHTCILGGRGVSDRTLLALASWRAA